MTATSTPAGGSEEAKAAGAVGAPATDPAFDAMAQRVLTRGHTTTWLNHWSLLHADFRALARMHTVGFDGTLLQIRLRAAGHEVARTSADLVLPHVFERLEDGTRITLIGAVPVASFVLDLLPEASVCTAGGWIDQYARAADDYFPTWVHAARLGWAWRIAHEPKRLIKRYTVEALDFVAHAPELISRLEAMGSFDDLGLVGGVTFADRG